MAMAGMNRRPASLGLGLLVLWCSSTVLTWLVPSNSPDRSLLAGSQLQRGRSQQSKVLRMAVGWILERAPKFRIIVVTAAVSHHGLALSSLENIDY